MLKHNVSVANDSKRILWERFRRKRFYTHIVGAFPPQTAFNGMEAFPPQTAFISWHGSVSAGNGFQWHGSVSAGNGLTIFLFLFFSFSFFLFFFSFLFLFPFLFFSFCCFYLLSFFVSLLFVSSLLLHIVDKKKLAFVAVVALLQITIITNFPLHFDCSSKCFVANIPLYMR